jgi:hypothetical protein
MLDAIFVLQTEKWTRVFDAVSTQNMKTVHSAEMVFVVCLSPSST